MEGERSSRHRDRDDLVGRGNLYSTMGGDKDQEDSLTQRLHLLQGQVPHEEGDRWADTAEKFNFLFSSDILHLFPVLRDCTYI